MAKKTESAGFALEGPSSGCGASPCCLCGGYDVPRDADSYTRRVLTDSLVDDDGDSLVDDGGRCWWSSRMSPQWSRCRDLGMAVPQMVTRITSGGSR